MNAVLLMPCIGPMQSWGTRSRFQERDTEREPTKSGVTGLLCAALGHRRSEPVDSGLTSLKMGVRVDREGVLRKDYQTAQDVAVASGKAVRNLISNRYFLADAVFTVGLEGEHALLERLHNALARPKWHIFLGRKSYLPSVPPFLPDGLVKGKDLQTALLEYPLFVMEKEFERRAGEKIRLIYESGAPSNESRYDQPVGLSFLRREFLLRFVRTEYFDIGGFRPGKGD